MSGKDDSVEHEDGIMSFQISHLYDFDSLSKVFRDSGNSYIELFDVLSLTE